MQMNGTCKDTQFKQIYFHPSTFEKIIQIPENSINGIEVSSSFFFFNYPNRPSVNTRICQIGLLHKAEMEKIDVIVYTSIHIVSNTSTNISELICEPLIYWVGN